MTSGMIVCVDKVTNQIVSTTPASKLSSAAHARREERDAGMQGSMAKLIAEILCSSEAYCILHRITARHDRLAGCTLQHCDALSGVLTGNGHAAETNPDRLGMPWLFHRNALVNVDEACRNKKLQAALVDRLAEKIPPDPLGRLGHVKLEARLFIPR